MDNQDVPIWVQQIGKAYRAHGVYLGRHIEGAGPTEIKAVSAGGTMLSSQPSHDFPFWSSSVAHRHSVVLQTFTDGCASDSVRTDSAYSALLRSVNILSNEDKVLPNPRSATQHRSWAERQALKRAAQQAESQALSQRIQASRDNGAAEELERARRRQVAEIEAFRSVMASALDAHASNERACLRPSMSSFKMVCALIGQRALENPALLDPEHRKTLGFYYRMIGAPVYWIALADQLVEHAKAGITRELTAFGPFAGLRVSTRALLLASEIENVTQLKAAIAASTITLDEDIASNGLTRRRWAELRTWLARQPG